MTETAAARRELLDVSGEEERLELAERETAELTPGEEAAYGRAVGLPGMRVADLGGEELDEPPAGPLAGLLNDGWEPEFPPTSDNRKGMGRDGGRFHGGDPASS